MPDTPADTAAETLADTPAETLAETLADTLADALAGRRLLDHPYYRAWQDGTLSAEDISRYAAQYRYFERALPEVLAATAAQIHDEEARELVEANRRDEVEAPAHLDLFDRFAAAVGGGTRGLDEAEPLPATRRLLDVYNDAVAAGPVAALAVIGAYEAQAAAIATTKGAALRQHLGLAAAGTEFWDVHASLEADHAAWTVQALEALEAPAGTVEAWARASADAWWSFLDDQQAALAA